MTTLTSLENTAHAGHGSYELDQAYSHMDEKEALEGERHCQDPQFAGYPQHHLLPSSHPVASITVSQYFAGYNYHYTNH